MESRHRVCGHRRTKLFRFRFRKTNAIRSNGGGGDGDSKVLHKRFSAARNIKRINQFIEKAEAEELRNGEASRSISHLVQWSWTFEFVAFRSLLGRGELYVW